MATDSRSVPGIVRGGVVVPKTESQLPDGIEVDIVLRDEAMTPELREELAAWQAAGDEAWAMIDAWEREESE